MHWYIHVLKNYVTFHGRAPRVEFWTFIVVNVAVGVILETSFGMRSWPERVFELLTFLPSLAVSIRRLHDSSHSGWWVLLFFIPIVGWIGFLVFMLLPSRPYTNAHGPEPHYPHQAVQA